MNLQENEDIGCSEIETAKEIIKKAEKDLYNAYVNRTKVVHEKYGLYLIQKINEFLKSEYNKEAVEQDSTITSRNSISLGLFECDCRAYYQPRQNWIQACCKLDFKELDRMAYTIAKNNKDCDYYKYSKIYHTFDSDDDLYYKMHLTYY